MLSLAIGLALMWLLAVVSKQKMTISGLPSILLTGFIAWGLGSFVRGLLHF